MDFVIEELPVEGIIICMMKRYGNEVTGRRVQNEEYTAKTRFIDLCSWVFADLCLEHRPEYDQYIALCKAQPSLLMRCIYLNMVLLAFTGMAAYMEEYYAKYMDAFEAAPFVEAARFQRQEYVTPRCVGCHPYVCRHVDGYCEKHNIRVI